MANLSNPKRMILTGGILAVIGPISVGANIGTSKFVSENLSNCVLIDPSALADLNIPLSLLSPEMNEELIHAEKVIVCFDHIGIVTDIVPFAQKAGIENL